jgi:hypothetical protein
MAVQPDTGRGEAAIRGLLNHGSGAAKANDAAKGGRGAGRVEPRVPMTRRGEAKGGEAKRMAVQPNTSGGEMAIRGLLNQENGAAEGERRGQ